MMAARRPCSSSAATTASPPASVTRRACGSRSAPPLCRTNWGGSCCWSKSIAPSASFRGTLIIGPDASSRKAESEFGWAPVANSQSHCFPAATAVLHSAMRASGRFTDSSRALAVMLGLALLLTPLLPSLPVQAQSELDALRQRDQELEAIRIEQKKAAETQAKLKEEIDAIGEDRRKLN